MVLHNKGGNRMTPILNMHDINVTEFLKVLDTCGMRENVRRK